MRYMMDVLTGKNASAGIAIGKVRFIGHSGGRPEQYRIEDIEAQKSRFSEAKTRTLEKLDAVYHKALIETGEESAQIFQIHKLMLEDQDFCDSVVEKIVNQKINAESAVYDTGKEFSGQLLHSEDSYMQQRASDVQDIARQVLQNI